MRAWARDCRSRPQRRFEKAHHFDPFPLKIFTKNEPISNLSQFKILAKLVGMAGLRARQKADRHWRILASAAELFRRAGYDGAKIETIAAMSQVSIGTIYNYYQNKGDLLVAIVSMEVNEVLNSGRRIIDGPLNNAAHAVHKLILNYVEHSLVYLSKEMWRQAIAISSQQPLSPFGRTYADLDRALMDQTCDLIVKLKTLGLLVSDTDVRSVGEVIFNNTNMMFTLFVKSEEMEMTTLCNALGRQNAAIIQAISMPHKADGQDGTAAQPDVGVKS